MTDKEKQRRQSKELDLVLSRLAHVLEHSTQDNQVLVAAIFQLFIEVCAEVSDEEYELSIEKVTELRKERIKLIQSAE